MPTRCLSHVAVYLVRLSVFGWDLPTRPFIPSVGPSTRTPLKNCRRANRLSRWPASVCCEPKCPIHCRRERPPDVGRARLSAVWRRTWQCRTAPRVDRQTEGAGGCGSASKPASCPRRLAAYGVLVLCCALLLRTPCSPAYFTRCLFPALRPCWREMSRRARGDRRQDARLSSNTPPLTARERRLPARAQLSRSPGTTAN